MMNNQGGQIPNQNWRSHSYIQNHQNQSIARPESYYNHYPSTQFINDYMAHNYMYPSLLEQYKPAQYPTPPTNPQSYNNFGMMTPEAYTRYYHKVQTYLIHNSGCSMKSYESVNNPVGPSPYMKNNQNISGMAPHTETQPVIMQSSYYLQKVNRPKDIIIIESDEQKMQHIDQNQLNFKIQAQDKPVPQQYKKVEPQPYKISIKLNEIQNASKSKELNASSFFNQQNVPNMVEKKQIIQKALPVNTLEPSGSKSSHPMDNQQKIAQKSAQQMKIISSDIIDDLGQKILRELQTEQMPDPIVKLFLKFKTFETRTKYEQNQEISNKILQIFKIYQAIVWFEKQRKIWMEEKLPDLVFRDLFGKFRMEQQNKPFKSKQTDLNLKPNQNDVPLKHNQSDKLNNQSSSQDFHLKKNNSIEQQHDNQYNQKQFQQHPYTALNFPRKTKKISKKQLQPISDDPNFNIKGNKNQKYQNQINLNIGSSLYTDRKLRERKKKKSKKDKLKQKDRQQDAKSSKDGKFIFEKSNQQHENIQEAQLKGKAQNAQLSNEDQQYIQKISRWAEKTLAADQKGSNNIQENKDKKQKNIQKNNESSLTKDKIDSLRVVKNAQIPVPLKKPKQRSTKASQQAFRQALMHKLQQQKQSKSHDIGLNLLTYSTSTHLSQAQKQQYQKILNHLAKQLRNNQSHGKIRVGKQYFQAKMPNFVRSQCELDQMIRQKRQKLMQRKMSVWTF